MDFLFFGFITAALFGFGAAIGSFLNVVIYRTVQGESWVVGRSKCESCGTQLGWYDNIPLLSYFMIRGKCRYCRTPLSLSHPVIEFITGALFVWWFWVGSIFFRLTLHPFSVIQPIFWLVVGLCLVVIFFADVRYMIIPDEAVAILLFISLCYRIALTAAGVMQPEDFLKTIAGAAVITGFFYSLWWLTKGRGMGFGDVKFAMPFSLLLGWPNVLIGTFLAFCLGSVVGITLMALGKKTFRQALPFGPFLVVSTLLTLVFGSSIWQWYMNLLQ